jgi:uncharacterized repeat protein (TIGR01451 family)
VLDFLKTTSLVSATKTVAILTDLNGNGQANPGDTLLYTVLVTYANSVIIQVHGRTASSVTYTNAIPANTTLVIGSVTTSQGVVTAGNNPGDTSIAVDVGMLAPFPGATIQFAVTVNPLPPGVTQITCQGTAASSTVTGVLSDDPNLPGPSDPTVFPVVQILPVGVPTLDRWGLFALAFALTGFGLTRLRRPRAEILRSQP